MKEPLDVSIVVINWNTSELLEGALESIVSTVGQLRAEVVVIDNASTDGGLDKVPLKFKQDSRFDFIQRETNIGWAAINIMLERARGKYIVTVDPDAIVHTGALQALYAFMEETPNAGAATAALLNSDGTPQIYFRRLMTPRSCFYTTVLGRVVDKYFFNLKHFKDNRYADLDVTKVSEVEQPSWPCLIWRPAALGTYIVNKEIPFYFVDVDMSQRVYKNGYKIFIVPTAVATHLKSTSFSRTNNKWRTTEYNRSLLVYLRTHYPFHLLWLRPLLLLDRGIRYIVLKLTGRELVR